MPELDNGEAVCPKCPKNDPAYDVYRESDDLYNYEDGVGAFLDIGELVVVGSASYPVHESYYLNSYKSPSRDYFDEQATNELRNVESLIATGSIIGDISFIMSFLTNPSSSVKTPKGFKGPVPRSTTTPAGKIGGAYARVKIIIELIAKDAGGEALYTVKYGDETLTVLMGSIQKRGNQLIVNSLDISGSAGGRVSVKGLFDIARQFGKEAGVEQVVINGNVRNTGKFAGQIPSQVIINVK